jgi:hypothetical protein
MSTFKPLNPETHNLVTDTQPMRSFAVQTISIDWLGGIVKHTEIIHAPTVKSVKRQVYLMHRNVQSIRIVELVDKK